MGLSFKSKIFTYRWCSQTNNHKRLKEGIFYSSGFQAVVKKCTQHLVLTLFLPVSCKNRDKRTLKLPKPKWFQSF